MLFLLFVFQWRRTWLTAATPVWVGSCRIPWTPAQTVMVERWFSNQWKNTLITFMSKFVIITFILKEVIMFRNVMFMIVIKTANNLPHKTINVKLIYHNPECVYNIYFFISYGPTLLSTIVIRHPTTIVNNGHFVHKNNACIVFCLKIKHPVLTQTCLLRRADISNKRTNEKSNKVSQGHALLSLLSLLFLSFLYLLCFVLSLPPSI